MMDDLCGKSMLVTGGGSGIGAATALLLAEAGCWVTIADINEASGNRTTAAIREAGGEATFVPADTSNEIDARRAVDHAVVEYGRLDGACNAAGVQQSGKAVHDVTIEDWDRCSHLNLRGLFLCNKHQIAAMLQTGGGAIVNVSSSGAIAGYPNGSEYCATKAGVLGFVRAAAVEYATQGIRVNAVLPGGTYTPMLQKAFDADPALEETVAKVHPMQRFARPREIATAIRWLLSDEASFVTGISMPVDGGHSAV